MKPHEALLAALAYAVIFGIIGGVVHYFKVERKK